VFSFSVLSILFQTGLALFSTNEGLAGSISAAPLAVALIQVRKHIYIFWVTTILCNNVRFAIGGQVSTKKCWTAGIANRAMDDHNDKTLEGHTQESCKQACENESSFTCKSAEYFVPGSVCYLSRTPRYLLVHAFSRSGTKWHFLAVRSTVYQLGMATSFMS
jgi:hypothetical protein